MRQQPRTLVEMPFLYAEKLGLPNYGPYYVRLALSSLTERQKKH